MSEQPKLLQVTSLNGVEKMYYENLTIVDKVNSVYYQGAIYQARNNEIVISTGRYKVIDLVKQGSKVYFLN